MGGGVCVETVCTVSVYNLTLQCKPCILADACKHIFPMNKKTVFWGVVSVVVVGGLIYFSERPGDEVSDEQVAQLGALVEQEERAADEIAEDTELAGTYESGILPAASTPGRSFILQLTDDGEATFTADYMNGQGVVVETGTWEEENGLLTTTLTTRRGYPISTGPLVMNYERADDGSLLLVDYDRARWGALGLTLRPAE